jgi:hypothetical protein
MNYIRCLLVALILFTSPLATAQAPISPPQITDPEIKGLQWNRYETSNFEILSIDKNQGDYLVANIEQIKSWLYMRWGLQDINFTPKCRVVCVPSKALFIKLFGKSDSCYRIDDKQAIIWLSLEDLRWKTSVVPKLLTEVCLQKLEKQTGQKFGIWVHSGMSVLNSDVPQIRQNIGNINLVYTKDLKVFWSKEILLMTQDILNKQDSAAKAWFEPECAAFCLMLIKEFGSLKFNQFLVASQINPESALQTVYGFKGFDDFDSSFKRYMYNISCDLTGQGQKVTPNSYITWPLSQKE